MKEYRFKLLYDYGGGDEREETATRILNENQDPAKYGAQLVRDLIYGKKNEFKMFGTPRRFFDCQLLEYKLLRDVTKDQLKKEYEEERERNTGLNAARLKREVQKMDFDYYTIRGKWNGANVSRRADKLADAERAADELEAGGVDGVEIVGVKAGTRETIRGRKKAKKPAKAAGGATTPAKKKKPRTPPKTKKKAASKKKAAQPAADSGQLDLFKPNEMIRTPNSERKVYIKFTPWKDCSAIVAAYYDVVSSGKSRQIGKYKQLLTTFEKIEGRKSPVDVQLSENEILQLIKVCQIYLRNNIFLKKTGTTYQTIKELKDTMIKAYYNV